EGNRLLTETAFICQTQCGPDDLLQRLVSELEITVAGNSFLQRQTALNDFLIGQAQAGRRVVVIIDEAQNLPEKTLEFIRLLSNFETPTQKLLTFVLSGQMELAEKLKRPKLAQLAQRVAVTTRLSPLDQQQTGAYIVHRLRMAGHAT